MRATVHIVRRHAAIAGEEGPWINDAGHRSYYCGLTMLATAHIIVDQRCGATVHIIRRHAAIAGEEGPRVWTDGVGPASFSSSFFSSSSFFLRQATPDVLRRSAEVLRVR